jgi:hypothetical protein
MPPVPAGVILEPEAPSPAERGEGLLLRLRVIPLNVSVFSLPARTLTRGNAVFEIPALRVPVLAAPAYPPEAAPAGGIASNEEASGVIAPNDAAPDSGAAPGSASASDTGAAPAAVPFPPLALPRIPLPKSLAASCETLYAEAKNLWDRAYCAEALAELRRNERDHAAGPLFGALRREAERSLGLSHTAGEKWRPGKPLLGFCLAFFLLALFTAAVSGGRKRRLVFSALFLSAALIFLYTFLERFMPWRPPGVLVRETVVRRIPDPEGAVIARFPEGLPVRIGPGGRGGGEAGGAKDRAAAWVWAEDFRKGTGVSEGWIPAEKLVFYSKQGPISRPGPGN